MESESKAIAMAQISQETEEGISDNNNSPDSRLSLDRLTTLPDEIIYRIFYFLDTQAFCRFSYVSRKLNQLSFTSPSLRFVTDFGPRRKLDFFSMEEHAKLRDKYTQFFNFVDKHVTSRVDSGIDIDRFVIHWYGTNRFTFSARTIVEKWIKSAIDCVVRELDVVLELGSASTYSLPACVFECDHLKVLKLTLSMTEFNLFTKNVGNVLEFGLSTVMIGDLSFGKTISNYWGSLTKLALVKIRWLANLVLDSLSLVELNIADSEFGRFWEEPEIYNPYSRDEVCESQLAFLCPSLKRVTISSCDFLAQYAITAHYLALENFVISGSLFHKPLKFRMVKSLEQSGRAADCMEVGISSLECFGIFGCHFKKFCSFTISHPFVKDIKISSCKFEESCLLRVGASPPKDLTVSNCQIFLPEKKIHDPEYTRQIMLHIESLNTLTLNSFDKHSFEFPLQITAPNLHALKWGGNPVDFRLLDEFKSLQKAEINMEPSCRHKNSEHACRCKLLKSKIYCAAMLLRSLKLVKWLKINIWPIEIFFMQNEDLIFFDYLEDLILTVDDSLAQQVPVIVSFLKAVPNLRILSINCENSSQVITDPNFICSLGLCPKSFSFLLSDDCKTIKFQRETAGCRTWKSHQSSFRDGLLSTWKSHIASLFLSTFFWLNDS